MGQTKEQSNGSCYSREKIQNPHQDHPLSHSMIKVFRYENSTESQIFASETSIPHQQSFGEKIFLLYIEVSDLGNPVAETVILQPTTHDTVKYWRPLTVPRSPYSKISHEGTILQGGDADITFQMDLLKDLMMSLKLYDTLIHIFFFYAMPKRGQKISDFWSGYIDILRELHWEGQIDTFLFTNWNTDAFQASRDKITCSTYIKLMEIDSDADET
ncbi:hypothetical protein AYI70_g7753 [Smittium culicis]|uniref:Uncharacterized protein n=1 Tax=Smittium culicis TaxID=133412 RepID=A0A1R1XJ88_9FUNG|nr:hypothetical protein AYI70_g7753 [Smittium culicis]